ncbi:uncharacterized protein E5676_scaffold676G00130 [Cucumis melo var. makuwa]|uniref:Uncharacterized protein n=1 Tax=Cucumis melo var. makuwa TaxID=1194695 RepID=A0A5D3BY61_CUCMM|nr:uncharacterized protein E5676_scaffold676G00130 [Cucumis melo var. makuwa]
MLDVRYSVVMLMGYVVDWNCMSMDLEVTVRYVVIIGLDIDHGVWTGKDNGLVWTEGTRLICASFGSTRLICAFYGTTRLLCRVRAQRGADRREVGKTREGHMDASGFLIASADEPCHNVLADDASRIRTECKVLPREIGRLERSECSDLEKAYEIERLKKLEAIMFEGSTDPADAEEWLNMLKKCFGLMDYPKE